MADTIGQQNPIRYRGYYYDAETGFYYCNSRYYDPEIGRWINADNQIAGVGGEVLGYNMFAYCMNNPVNMSDPSGNWPKWDNIKNYIKKAINKTKKVAKKIISAFTLELGLGMGLRGGAELGGFNIEAGLKSDSITAILNSEKSKIGQRQEAGVTVDIGPVSVGPELSDWIPISENDAYESQFKWVDDDYVLEFGMEIYIFYGFTANLSINLGVVEEGVVMIYE